LDELTDLTAATIAVARAGRHDDEASAPFGAALRAVYARCGDAAVLRDAVAAAADEVDDPRALATVSFLLRVLFKGFGDLLTLRQAVRVSLLAVAQRPDDPLCLADAAESLSTLFDHTGDAAALHEAVRTARAATVYTPAGDPERAQRSSTAGNILSTYYEQVGDLSLLVEALHHQRDAVAHAPASISYRSNLGLTLRVYYERTGDVDALRESADLCRAAVAGTSTDDRGLAIRLNTLGSTLHALYLRFGDPAVLRESVDAARGSVALSETGHSDRLGRLSNLGTKLLDLFQLDHDVELLHEAVGVCRAAVTVAGDRYDSAIHLTALGSALDTLFTWTRDPAALDESLRVRRAAVAATPPGHPDLPGRSSNLGNTLMKLFEWREDPSALSEAVSALRAAIEATPAGQPNRAGYLTNLANALAIASGRTDDVSVLDEAIGAARAAVDAMPDDHPAALSTRANLATVLHSRYTRLGDLDSLREAIELTRAVAALESPERGQRLINLTVYLSAFATCTGDVDDLREAVRAGRAAVAATSPGEPSRPTAQANLGMALCALYEREGEVAPLREALTVTRAALAAFAANDPARAPAMANIGGFLRALYLHNGEVATLRESAETTKAALDVFATDHPDRPAALSNLGQTLRELAERTGDLGVLLEAAGRGREAVKTTPAERPARATFQSHLGLTLLALFHRTGAVDVLRASVASAESAIDATPADHASRISLATNLGLARRLLFECTGEGLEDAIAACQEAVNRAGIDHASRPMVAANLGLAVSLRSGDDPAHLAKARDLLRETVAASSAPVSLRVGAAQAGADVELRAGAYDEALRLAEQAVALLPRLSSRYLGRADRGHRLTSVFGVASTAAAAAIAAGRPDRAVELLEQSRGVLLAETLAIHADLTALRERAPELASALVELREAIEVADHAADEPDGADRLRARRIELDGQWNDLVRRVRDVRGFTGFLLPPPIRQLRRAAVGGAIVYVTVHQDRGHALIVRNGEPVTAVALPGLTWRALNSWTDRLRVAQAIAGDPAQPATERTAAQRHVVDVFGWTWATVVDPVLRELRHTTTPEADEPWPRVWWCPTGLLSFLPLHAAGDPSTRDNTLDRVVSSYTPTIRALQSVPGSTATSGATVVVAVPDPPGHQPLSGVAAETDVLRRLVPGATVLARPDHDSVIAALADHEIAHFACHGLADWADPTRSHLVLHDHATTPLTIGALARLHLPNARMAYLSACSTTDTSPRYTDEATHLTAAFHLAGYSTVIGTLWPVNDTHATTITESVYKRLTHNGTTPPDPSQAASALHHTLRESRNQYRALPTRWAPYIHTGR
jgi:tetratricopeptide (TPR) repeat protein